MGVFSDRGISRKHTDCFQPKQRSFATTEGGHHRQHALHIARPKDGSQWLLYFSARQRNECVFHYVDAFIHRQKLLDLLVVKNEYVHGGRKDITARIVSEARASARASSDCMSPN